MEALISQHPTRALPLYLTNLHHNRQPNLTRSTPTNLMRALLTQPVLRPPLLTLYWQWSINPLTPLMMMLQTSPRFFQLRGLERSKSVNATSSSMPITPTINWWTVVPMGALLVQTCVSSTRPTAKSTFQALTTMKLLVLMWSLLQPSSTPLLEKSLASSMNMPTLERDHPSIHQVNLNGSRPLLMKNPSKLVAHNLSLLWMDILSLSSSEMVLAYATSLGRPTDQDMDTYPHVFFTSPDEWDPSVLDHDPPHLDGLDPSQVPDQPFGDPMFDAYGDFNERIIANLNILLDAPQEVYGLYTSTSYVPTAKLHQGSPQEPDWHALRPFFAWPSPSSIKDTFNVTTRHGTAPHTQDYIKKHFKSRNPVFNIPRRSEAVATDTIFSDTPAVDDGSTMAQFFCGRDTLVCDAYGIKSTKQFINTLSDNIRKRGAMDTLISDGGKYEISKRVTDLLRSLFIQDYQSEPYHQHQNKAENRFGLAKRYTNTVMNTFGCPACCWLLCLQYICVVLNHLASPTLQGICPVQALEGTTSDISFLLHFSFYEPVYYRIDSSEPDLNLPSSSNGRKVIGLVLLTIKVTVSPGGSSLRILRRFSFVLEFEVPSELQQTSILHHLQGRGPHFLFPFLILNNLNFLCHLILLMNPHPLLSILSTVSLVKMKIIQSPWQTLTFPIFLADPFFYHLRIMGSATWPKSLTLMTMDNPLKTLNSS